jgi:hypothetical protein
LVPIEKNQFQTYRSFSIKLRQGVSKLLQHHDITLKIQG